MSKICFLNPFFYPYQGGTEKHALEVGARLAAKGFDITVLCARMPRDKKDDAIGGVKVHRVDALYLINSLPTFSPVPPPIAIVPAMSRAIRDEMRRNELFHIHNRFVYSPADAKSIKEGGRKLCITLHNARPAGISPATDLLGALYDETSGKEIMAECDHILGVSRNTLESTVPPEFMHKASVAYNGVATEIYSPGSPTVGAVRKHGLENRKVILTVCRLENQKGLDYMIGAMRKLAKKDKSYLWVLVGTGSLLAKFESLRKDAKLRDNYLLIGEKITESEIVDLYRACDLFVLPSVWEPFGMVLCEALSCGKPVVSTTAGGIPEVVSPDCGMLVSPKDGDALAGAIEKMFSSPKRMRKMGAAGRSRVTRLFTWDRTAECYRKLYDSLL
jgi:glycosyltransferase involved in cell wall biosynthesis